MATVWNTDYIINIIHRLRNAYVQALAYRWQLAMQSITEKLGRGELLKVPNASGKAAFWIIHAFDDDPDSCIFRDFIMNFLVFDSNYFVLK